MTAAVYSIHCWPKVFMQLMTGWEQLFANTEVSATGTVGSLHGDQGLGGRMRFLYSLPTLLAQAHAIYPTLFHSLSWLAS